MQITKSTQGAVAKGISFREPSTKGPLSTSVSKSQSKEIEKVPFSETTLPKQIFTRRCLEKLMQRFQEESDSEETELEEVPLVRKNQY